MKKKNLKSLSLNKKSISNLQSKVSTIGGKEGTMGSCYAPCPDISGPKGPCLPTNVGPDCNSDNGCITNPDQTMTCPAWGC